MSEIKIYKYFLTLKNLKVAKKRYINFLITLIYLNPNFNFYKLPHFFLIKMIYLNNLSFFNTLF